MEGPGMEPSDGQAPRLAADELQDQLSATRRALAEAERERQASRDREALLRNELQHHVRNMLAVVRSIFSRTVDSSDSLEEAADHFRGRLDAISRHQAARSRDPGGRVDLEQIVRDELQGFQFGDDPMIGISGPEVGLRHDVAQMFSLAIHELATNSIKFGVLAAIHDRGHVTAEWRVADRMLHFSWSESGVPVVASAPLRRGFGRQFIEDALPYQIGARTRFELRPGGMLCEIVAPLDAPTSSSRNLETF
jgi:two-component sensor histidine kinase